MWARAGAIAAVLIAIVAAAASGGSNNREQSAVAAESTSAAQAPAAATSTAPPTTAAATTTTAPTTSAPSTTPPTATASVPVLVGPDGIPRSDPNLTPGTTFVVAAADVCQSGYSDSVRDVTDDQRVAVFAAYGIPLGDSSSYQLDHLIPLELGGDDADTNLWPEPLQGPQGALAKDGVEDALHTVVCDGRMDLAAAQDVMRGDWWTWTPPPAPTTVPPTTAAATPVPFVASTAPPTTNPPANVYYANCTAARNAGAAPIYRGQPGYRAGLDRDGDGIACE